MKSISKLVIALATLGSCAVATAQPYGPADQQRRERNREEAIANYERMQRDGADSRDTRTMHSTRDGTVREDARDAKNSARSKTHDVAQSTRSFTHRQLNKVRNFGERQQRKYPNRPGEKTENKSETALGK